MALLVPGAAATARVPVVSEPLLHPDGTPVTIADALVASGLAKSKGEARRLIEQGGAYVVTGDDATMAAMLAAIPVTGRIVVQSRADDNAG
jgi:tyrosyl-tRNA synthetase